MSSHRSRLAITLSALGLFAGTAHGQDWPEIFDPLVLRTLNLQMSSQDWQTIQNDESFDIEVPTLLWLDGEAPILVSIRRKSADALTEAPGYLKVSYKIDINELVSGQNWHGLRAVSLDNGDDQDVVTEGLAWYLHRQAAGVYGYDAGLASWVRLVINGVDTGVYVNAEQRDKRFLENRGLWVEDETWLYEVEDLQGFELDEGGPEDSPTFQALCYSPFASPASCPTPDAATLAAQVPALVDMQGLLTMAAVDAFAANPDAIFSHSKNFYFADYLVGMPRLHFPWDLDSAFGGGGIDADVYEPASAYSNILLAVPEFRDQYSQILNDLVCGPYQEQQLHAFLDALEPVLSAALEADPNNQLGGESVASHFDGRKAWLSQRIANVSGQIEGFVPCGAPDPWTELGLGLAGTSGVPQLEGSGSLIGGTPVALALSNAKPLSGTTLVFGLSLLAEPFKGGTMVPFPNLLLSGLFTNASGALNLSGTWPQGIPSDTTFWLQAWIADPAGPAGFAASNGLRATTP